MTENILTSSAELTPEQKTELSALKEAFTSSLLKIMDANNTVNADLDLFQVWPETNNLPELYNQLSEMKECLDSFRPLSESMLQNIKEQEDVLFTYESNRIEGNSLTYMDTYLIIQKGETVGGKKVDEIIEAKNHKKAIEYIDSLIADNVEFKEANLLELHRVLMTGLRDDPSEVGFYRRRHVRIRKSDHVCPNNIKVPDLMKELFVFYEINKVQLHPVALAAQMHQLLVNIHPFMDGNGRTSRLFMNYILESNHYPRIIIGSDDTPRQDYYNALEHYHTHDSDAEPFDLLIAQYAKNRIIDRLNFFAQDMTDTGKEKGYAFFKKIQPLIEAGNKK